jgi:hypothetical protein
MEPLDRVHTDISTGIQKEFDARCGIYEKKTVGKIGKIKAVTCHHQVLPVLFPASYAQGRVHLVALFPQRRWYQQTLWSRWG